jgi:hypothetical protein
MTETTHILVLTAAVEDDAIQWLQRKGVSLSSALRTEDLPRKVYVASPKGMTIDGILEYLRSAPWRQRELVEVIHVRRNGLSVLRELPPKP